MADPKNTSSTTSTAEEQAARNAQTTQETTTKQDEKLGNAPHLVRAPDEVNPGDVGALAIEQAEQARLAREQRERDELAKTLPQSTIDEMNAGKAALGRKEVATPQVVKNKE